MIYYYGLWPHIQWLTMVVTVLLSMYHNKKIDDDDDDEMMMVMVMMMTVMTIMAMKMMMTVYSSVANTPCIKMLMALFQFEGCMLKISTIEISNVIVMV